MSGTVIAVLVLLVVLLVAGYWYKYMRCQVVLPPGAAALASPGSGYCGVADWQPNTGSNAGDAVQNIKTAAACAAVCDGRPACNSYKWFTGNNSCFPLNISSIDDYNTKLSKVTNWNSATKLRSAAAA